MKSLFCVIWVLIVVLHNGIFASPLSGSGPMGGGSAGGSDLLRAVENGNVEVIGPGQTPSVRYAALASSANNAKMGVLSNTNRRVLLIMPGVYSDSPFTLTQYVDIKGMSRDGCVINFMGATQGTPAMSTPSLATAETGITNLIESITVTGGALLGAGTTTANRVTHIVNCRFLSTLDCIYIRNFGTRTSEFHVFSSYMYGTFDCITNQNANGKIYLYSSEIVAEATTALSDNPSYYARCLYNAPTGGITEAYSCRISATSNSSGEAGKPSYANCIDCQGGTINVFNCSMFSSATTDGGAGVLDGDCVQATQAIGEGGTVGVYNSVISGSTGGYDINNAGTCYVMGSKFDIADVNGTLTYLNGIGGTIPTVNQNDGVTIYSDGGTLKVSTGP